MTIVRLGADVKMLDVYRLEAGEQIDRVDELAGDDWFRITHRRKSLPTPVRYAREFADIGLTFD